MPRPYRHIPTADLEFSMEYLYREINVLTKQRFNYLIRPYRVELRRVSRELDRRRKED